ncbi:MAG: DUF1801 domain-containing protein [Actinomycetes bacterium]|jgi:uncharacterized protein YdhG (YjbR/CyaY superfamily)|nr:MAG: hypothetical protein DIU67_03595 [Actinomycetota bacterium]
MPGEKETGFSEAEKAAMRERSKELRSRKEGKGLEDVLARISEMTGTDREIAETVHRIVTEVAPDLQPKTWYGMPGYARDGKVVVFFQASAKFGTRYSTLGFNDVASLDDGDMWATAYAITAVTPAVEKEIARLVKKAAG